MKKQFLSKAVPRGTRTIWRYLSALFILFTFAIGNVWADEIFSWTATSQIAKNASEDATGGTVKCTGSGFGSETPSGSGFYKFNSSTQLTCTLSSGTFAAGDEITFTFTSAGNNKTVGVEIQETSPVTQLTEKIATAGTSVSKTYTVTASDGIQGQNKFSIKRVDSNFSLGGVSVTRSGSGSTDPVSSVTVAGATTGYATVPVELTATPDETATGYKWFVDGVEQSGKTSATFNFEADTPGTYSIVAKARNDYNTEGEWIASSAHSLTVTSLYGDLIHFTAKTSGSSINEDLPAANIGGIVGGTVHQKSQKNGKLNTGHYYSLTLASGSFQVGDTVRIVVTPEGDNHNVPATMMLSSVQDNSNLIGSVSGLSASSSANITADIILTAGAQTIFLSRDGTVTSQNPIVVSVSVIRPMAAKSVAYDLTAVKINGTAISAADLATLKTADAYLVDLMAGYAAAPVVKFARQTTTTYEDDSQKVANDTITVTASEVSGKWQAQATIGTITYTVKAAKQSSAKVYYYDGETKIGEETVAIGGHPAEYEAKQSKNLAAFVGWYSDADLADGHLISDIAAEVISADKTVYGKWTYTYAQSVNVEKWVLDNSKTPNSDKTGALISLLGTRGFASNLAYEEKKVELDSLNDDKGTGRNYAYLGLKVKSGGKMLDFRLAKNSTVKVKFGNVGTTPLYAINGGEYSNMPIEEKVFTYIATGEDYISIKMADNDAVVFKQIMIDAEIQDVTLPEPTRHAVDLSEAGETEHGTLAVASPEEYNWLAEGAAVTLSVAVDDGYYIESVTLNGEALTPSENVYSFAMPNATANVVATFAEIVPNNVTYKANNGGEDADILEENATEIAGCSFTYAGHKFNGWNTEANGSGDAYAEGDPVLSPLTLYAQWREYFVITYKDGDDVLDTEDVFVGEAPVGIADPVKAFNLFQGWTLAGSDEVIDVTDLNATTTVYAKWEAIDACFYYLPTKPAEAVQLAVDALVPGANGGSMKVLGDKIYNSPYGLSFESSGSAAVLVTLDKNMEAATVIKAKVVVNPKDDNARGLLLRNAANSATVQEWTFVPAQNPDTLEFTYTVQAGDGLAGTNQFCIKRSTNAWLISLMVSNCAPEQFTVTYKDGEATLGTEGVYENGHPTADGINTHKKGYEFQGWAETVDGAVVDLDDITITAAKNLFAQYTVMDCSPKGVKFSMAVDPAKAPTSNLYYPATTPAVGDLAVYATVSGGLAQAVNTNTGTTKNFEVNKEPYFKLSGSESHMRILLDCPLAENDTIKFDKTERIILSFDSLKTKSENIAKTTSYYIVPAAYAGEDTIHIWYNSNGVSVNGVQVIRPEIYAVSFNLMGHGSAIAPVNVVKGAKIVAPTAPTDENFAFAGWYKENTLSNAWDFDNDVVAANTTLYAKWLDMTDATLKSLKYGATDIVLEDGVYEYNVELPALSTSVPALTAETSNPNATKEIANATEFDAEGHATSTVVVTPEKEGAASQTYTVNFAKAAAIELQDVTGNMTWDFSKDGLANNAAVGTEVVMANVEGVVNNDDFHSDNIMVTANKQAGTKLQASMIKFHTTVSGSVIVKCSNTGNNKPDRYLMVNGVETELHSTNQTVQTYAEYVPAGDVVLTVGGDGNMFNFTSVEFKLDNDLEPARTDDWLAPGEMGTICIPQGAVAVGADIYDLVGKEPQYGKIVFETVKHMKPGKPYMFISKGDRIDLILTDEAAASEPDNSGAMKGTFEQLYLTDLDNVYYFADHALWSCVDLTQLNVPANRAYVKLDEVKPIQDPTPAPGRVRMSLGVNGAPAVTTGVENAQMDNAPVKMIINGQLFILRGEKMFDATGRLVK